MRIRETNTRTGESHIYDTEERSREIEENHKNKMLGYHSPFRDVENGDIITQEYITEELLELEKGV